MMTEHTDNRLSRWVQRHPVKSQRLLEILPGVISWSLIIFPLWGSFFVPVLVAYYILAFNVYWMWRSFSMAGLAILAHFRISASVQFDWLGDVKEFPDWEKLYHIVVIPSYKTPLKTLRRTLTAIKNQSFPTDRIAVMISFEVREGEAGEKRARDITKEFGSQFKYLWTTMHPDIKGEVKGKSSNVSWGAKLAKKYLVDEAGVDIDYVTITSEDDDTVLHHHYFSALSYQFLDNPDRYRRVWQAAVMFYNNIWQVTSPVRVMSSMFSVIQLYLLMRPDTLINFSTYSSSLRLIDEIGYWDVDVIPEDWRLFFKAYFATQGKVKVDPLFVPIYNDAVESVGFFPTMVSQYEQIKRWAWGVSDLAYVIKQWIRVPHMPFWEKTVRVLRVLEHHLLWPVNWFAITIGAILPPLLNPDFARTNLGKTLPQVSSAILTVSLVSLVVIFIIDAKNRPPRPKHISVMRTILQPVEFLLLPVVGFFFSALPGIDAHTRLMVGRYIEYRVTEKV